MPNSPGAYAFYEKITGNSVAEPSTISLFSIDHPTPQVIQTRSYTFTNYLLGEKTVKRLESSMLFSFLRKTTPQKQILSTSDWPTSFVYFFQPLYSEPHMLRKTHTTFAYRSHWLRLWSFLSVIYRVWYFAIIKCIMKRKAEKIVDYFLLDFTTLHKLCEVVVQSIHKLT